MKSRIFILSLIMVVSLTILTSGGTKKEISVDEVLEVFCHTWINHDYDDKEIPSAKAVGHPDGTISEYGRVDLPLDTPHYKQRYTIHEAWTDSDGNIWFKSTHKDGVETWYQINKISESGNVWEYHRAYGDLSNLPDEINPDAPKYRIYYRQ